METKAAHFIPIMKAYRVSCGKCGLSSKGNWKTILTDLIHPISLEHVLHTNFSDDVISYIPLQFKGTFLNNGMI